ncbi:MAG: hypothetical protein ACO2ZP_01255 [Bacteriovoracaceae bacterium]
MTISSENRANLYTGNDSTTVFPFTYKIFDESHLEVITLDTATSVETVLTLNVDYTVSGIGADGGGTITYPISGDPLASGDKLYITRTVPLTQLKDLLNQGGFYAETHEEVFDYLTMIALQLQEQLDRTPKVTQTSGNSGDQLIGDVNSAKVAAEAARDAAQAAQANAETAETNASTSEGNASTSEINALASEVAAANILASINLPTLSPGVAGYNLQVNQVGDAYVHAPSDKNNAAFYGFKFVGDDLIVDTNDTGSGTAYNVNDYEDYFIASQGATFSIDNNGCLIATLP